jgi:hypothetical protein
VQPGVAFGAVAGDPPAVRLVSLHARPITKLVLLATITVWITTGKRVAAPGSRALAMILGRGRCPGPVRGRCRLAPHWGQKCPEGGHSGLDCVRRPAVRGACAGGRGGAGPSSGCCCFRAGWVRPWTSAAALVPGLGGCSFLGACLSLAGAAGSVGRASVVSELGGPLDDYPAAGPRWVGFLLHPYVPKLCPKKLRHRQRDDRR